MTDSRKYDVKVVFADGNTIERRIEAKNRTEAKRIVCGSDEFIEFYNKSIVVEMKIQGCGKGIKPWNNYLQVTNVPNKEGWYMVTDLRHNIRLEFRKEDFEKQNVYPMRGEEFTQTDALQMAGAMKDIGEWLVDFFPELLGKKGVKPKPKNEGPDPEDHKYRTFWLKNKTYAWIMKQADGMNMEHGEYLDWLCSDDE